MMRLNKKRIFAIAILLALFALMQLLCAWRVQAIERSLPHAAALDSPNGVGITMAQVLSTDNNTGVKNDSGVIIGAMSLEMLQTVSVAGVGASEPAYTAYATSLSGMCLPFRYAYGNWFLPDESITVSMAVIPQSLSLSLFGTDMPVGNSLSVGQTEYQICGVYRDEKGFLQKIGGDGTPCVYLYNPLRMAQLPVSVLYLTDDKQSDVQLLNQQASSIFKTLLNGTIIDYRQQIQLAQSLWYLSVLLCVFFTVILLMTFAGLQFVRLHARQDEPSLKRLKRLLIGTFITAITLTLLMLLLNQFRIPAIYLPHNNIFDFSSYMKSIESFFTFLHKEGWTNHFEWAFVTQMLVLLVFSLSGIACYCAGVLKLQSFIAMHCHSRINDI